MFLRVSLKCKMCKTPPASIQKLKDIITLKRIDIARQPFAELERNFNTGFTMASTAYIFEHLMK